MQGEEAKTSIVACIKQANELKQVDTLIVGRGGGSLEDLWAFNEEIVARAIFNSQIPIISAVGHETDTTIADRVADKRAETPTAAAVLATPSLTDVKLMINQLQNRLTIGMIQTMTLKKKQLEALDQHYILKNPQVLYEQRMLRFTQASDKLKVALQQQLVEKRQQLLRMQHRLDEKNPSVQLNMQKNKVMQRQAQLNEFMQRQLQEAVYQYQLKLTKLEILNPLSVLKKGYALAVDERNHPIATAKEVQVNQVFKLIFDDGHVQVRTEVVSLESEVSENGG